MSFSTSLGPGSPQKKRHQQGSVLSSSSRLKKLKPQTGEAVAVSAKGFPERSVSTSSSEEHEEAARMEETSSESPSDNLSLSDAISDNLPEMPASASGLSKRTYRKRRGSKVPSVLLCSVRICRKAALEFIGCGAGRVSRAEKGLADGRTKACRVTQGHPALLRRSGNACVDFLWTKCCRR